MPKGKGHGQSVHRQDPQQEAAYRKFRRARQSGGRQDDNRISRSSFTRNNSGPTRAEREAARRTPLGFKAGPKAGPKRPLTPPTIWSGNYPAPDSRDVVTAPAMKEDPEPPKMSILPLDVECGPRSGIWHRIPLELWYAGRHWFSLKWHSIPTFLFTSDPQDARLLAMDSPAPGPSFLPPSPATRRPSPWYALLHQCLPLIGMWRPLLKKKSSQGLCLVQVFHTISNSGSTT